MEPTLAIPSLRESIALAAQARPRKDKLAALAQARAEFTRGAESLNARLVAGEIDELRWNLDMRELVKDLHASAFAIGRSGKWEDMRSTSWREVANVTRQQYAYLRGWAQELRTGGMPSLARMNARAGLYGAAASQSFERGAQQELGLNPALFPAQPGEGSPCRSNCRCRWAVRVLSKARGDYDVTWRMAAAEHCGVCRARARVWKRLRIRGGRFLDVPEAINANR